MKKRLFCLVLAFAMSLSLSVPAFASSQQLTREEKIEHLVQCGIPADVLSEHTDRTIDEIYELSLTNYIELADVGEGSGLRLSDGSGNAARTITDGSFGMNTIAMAVYESDRVTFRYYAIYTKYEWTSSPEYRIKDAIAVNWNGNYLTYMPGTFYYEPSFKIPAASSWTVDTANCKYTNPDISVQGGLGVWFNLVHAPTVYLRGTVFFQLEKVDPSFSNQTVTINSNYAHTTTTAAANSLSFSPTSVGISIVCQTTYQYDSSATSVTLP